MISPIYDIDIWGRRGRQCMVVGFTTTYAISTYHHLRCEFEYHSADTTLCDKVCLIDLLQVGDFPRVLSVSSTNKTDRHDIAKNIVESCVKHHEPKPHLNRPMMYWIVDKYALRLTTFAMLLKIN